MNLGQALAQHPALSVGRTGNRGRAWHFWFRLYDDPHGYYYEAICGIKTKSLKRPQPSLNWTEMKVCARCEAELKKMEAKA